MRKIVKRPLARQDLKQIRRYSFKERGEEAQAGRYFAEIEAGILKLQAHPHLGKSREDLGAGYYALRVNQHVGYYMLNTRCAAGDEAARPTLRAACRPDLSAYRTVVRGTLSFCADEADGYLLACQRYVELNPVRAGMVAAPGECPWSSYRANAPEHSDGIVRAHPHYQSSGSSDDARQAAYRRLLETGSDAHVLQRLRESTNGGYVLGEQQFVEQIAAMVGRRTWKRSPGRPRRRAEDTAQGGLSL